MRAARGRHGALACGDRLDAIQLIEDEREMVAGRGVSRVQHLAASDRAEPQGHDNELGPASVDDNAAPVGNGPLERVVLCVGQAAIRCA